jgi:hypothetical protein
MNLDWAKRGNCRGLPPPAMFEDATKETARKVCAGCPVQHECLTYAMRLERAGSVAERDGIYGGFSPRQRAALARGAFLPVLVRPGYGNGCGGASWETCEWQLSILGWRLLRRCKRHS